MAQRSTARDDAHDEWPRAYLYRRVVQAKLFLDRRYAERLELDDICGAAAFSKFHFLRLFRQIVGTTPHRYLTQVRVERARAALLRGESVTATCFAVGFESLGSFSRLFHRAVGQTPSAFRRQALLRAEAVRARPLAFVPGCFAQAHGFGGTPAQAAAD